MTIRTENRQSIGLRVLAGILALEGLIAFGVIAISIPSIHARISALSTTFLATIVVILLLILAILIIYLANGLWEFRNKARVWTIILMILSLVIEFGLALDLIPGKPRIIRPIISIIFVYYLTKSDIRQLFITQYHRKHLSIPDDQSSA